MMNSRIVMGVGALASMVVGLVVPSARAASTNFGQTWDYSMSASGIWQGDPVTWQKATNWRNDSTGVNFSSGDNIPQYTANTFGSTLIDGNQFIITPQVSSGYKVATAPTINGTNLKIGVANGVQLTIEKIGTAISNMNLFVDETSKLIIKAFDGQLTPLGTNNLHIDSPEGLRVNGNLLSGTYQVYLGEKGSISIGGWFNGVTKTIFSDVKINVSKTGAKRVTSRIIMSYGDKRGDFNFSNSSASDVGGLSLTKKDSVAVSDAIGSYAFTQSATAVTIQWVEGSEGGGGDDPEPTPAGSATALIAINFNSLAKQINQQGQINYRGDASNQVTGNDAGALDYAIPVAAWLQVEDKIGEETASVYDLTSQTVDTSRSATVNWTSANVWSYTGMTAKILNGYLDDSNSGAAVTVSNIPFDTYDVIFYAATDANNKKFGAPEINGKRYTFADGKTVEGESAWGTSQSLTAAYGTNALRVNGLSGNLTVKGYGNNSAGYRGCIAAIVIVEMKDEPDPSVGELTLINFDNVNEGGVKINTPATGWYNTNLEDVGPNNITDDMVRVGDIIFTTSGNATGKLWAQARPSGDFPNSGNYVDIKGKSHTTIAEEMRVSLNAGSSFVFNEDVYKSGLQNGQLQWRNAQISGLDANSSYLIYVGTGVGNRTTEFKLESSGCTSIGDMVYVSTADWNANTEYKELAVGTGVSNGANGILVVRMNEIKPLSDGSINFQLNNYAGINFLAIRKLAAKEYVFENTDCDPSNPGWGNYTPATLKIPESADLPAGTKLRIKSVTFAMRVNNGAAASFSAEYLTINGVQSEGRNGLAETPEEWSLGNRMTYEFKKDAIVTVGEEATLGTVKGDGGSSQIRIYLFRTTEEKYSDILLTMAMEMYRPVYKIVAEKVAGPTPVPEVELYYDWTFDGTSLASKGLATPVTLTSEGTPIYLEDDELYVYDKALNTASTPWGNITYPATTWSAMVSGIMPTAKGNPLVTFGTRTGGEIGLVSGDSDNEVLLIRTTKDETYSTLGSVEIENAQSSTHVYVIVRKSSCVMLYVDGVLKLNVEVSNAQVGGGLQVGSVNGGITSGLTKVNANNVGYSAVEAIRIYKNELTEDDLNELSEEFPVRAVEVRDPTTIYWKGGNGTIDSSTTFKDGEGNEVKYVAGDEIVIDGDCNVTLARSVETLHVKNGAVLQVASAGGVTAKLYVDDGGTFDVNGVADKAYPIVLNGGTLANYGAAIGDEKKQYWNLEVTADSFIATESKFGTIAGNYGANTLKLGGYTLTKRGEGNFYIANATFTDGGTLDIQEGTIVLRSGTMLPDNLTVKIGPNGETITAGTGFAINSGKIIFDISACANKQAEITLLAAAGQTAEKFALADGTDENWEIQIDENAVKAVNTYTLLMLGGRAYPTLEMAFANVESDGEVLEIVDTERLVYDGGKLILDGEEVDLTQYAITLSDEGGVITVSRRMEGGELTIAEICPKPTAKDPNGVEAGWVELVNVGTGWAELSDYSFGRFNRGKKFDMAKVLPLPPCVVAPGSKVRFYTTEGYIEGDDLLFVEPKMTDAAMAEINGVLVYPAKVNPKKYPMVTLTKGDEKICSVVIPNDTPDDASIIVEPTDEAVLGGATRHYLKVGAKLTAIGPEVGPLYGVKHDFSDINATPPAIPGENYAITLDVNPVYGGGEKDEIQQVFLVYRTDLDETTRKEVEMVKGEVVSGHGQQWTAEIPSGDFPEAGHLIQWKAKIVDAAGITWSAPQFLGPDDGYEWYGTIVEPTADQLSDSLTTFHLFADAETADDKNAPNRNMQIMNIDYDEFMSGSQYADLRTRHPYGARVAFYDSSTSQYYDNVRIDLRGNSSKGFNKKSHGLRFGKTHPLSTVDCVSGQKLEIRKSSFIAEFGDPSFLRQMTAFWLFNKHDSPAPFHYPARLNLNGKFYQLGFHSERFTDELIEDIYGLDPLGYGYKNIGSFGNGTTAGGIEKKTPDDGNEADLSVLNAFCYTLPTAAVTSDADKEKYTKIVVEKMDLPAWINYMALTKITQECDDVWANLSGYYDNPLLLDGVRPGSTGTWRPLAYDMQLTFGQWHHADYASFTGLMSNHDWFKSHPLYGGYTVRAHTGEGGLAAGRANRAYEAIFQSEKFRRLYLRRVRTLMDEELGAPDTTGKETWQTSEVNFMVQMRKMAGMMSVESEMDHAQWGYCNGAGNINVWGNNYPKTIEEAMADIWDNYVIPRRVHLYETHAASNTEKQIGYGEKLIAGIPAAQKPIAELKAGFSAEYDATLGAVVIRSTNDEAIDLSNWKLSGPINMTIPEGTVIDMAIGGVAGEVYVTADRRATIAAMTITDQVVIGNGTAGSAEEIGLVASDGTDVLAVEKSEQEKYLRLWGFAGAPDGLSTDENEFIVFTNLNQAATLDASGARIHFEKTGEAENRCNFLLPEGTIIEAGGWVRFNQADVPWTKISDGFQDITLSAANGIIIEQYINLDQATIIGGKGSGKMAVHNPETDEWYAILITEAPGYEPPPPPPPVDLNWANTNVTEKITLAPGYTYNFANVNFEGGLELPPGEYTIKNDGKDSINSAAFVSAAGASITFVGKGRFELTGENITEPLFTAKDLYITKGTFAIETSNETAKVAAVSLSGNFGLSGEGKLDMTLDGTQPYGIELTNKKMTANFEAGAFTATLGGTKASAFKFKGSDAVTLSGGTMDVTITGTGAKVLNGGTIVFEDGYVCNVAGDETAADATVFEAGKTLTVNGGTFDISVPGAGSQIFTTADDPEEKDLTLTINGGTFTLLAGDDCVKSAGNDAAAADPEKTKARDVVITGGNFYGVSLGNDVIDSNGDIIITGGNILAYTTAVEEDGNGSTGLDVNEGRFIEVTGGNVIAIGGPNSSFHYDGALAWTAEDLVAATFSGKFVKLDGQAGKFNTRVWAKLPELDVDEISLFVFTPGINPAVAPTVQDETPSEEFATGFHDLYIDDVPPGELVITKICARCQPNVPAAKDLGWILLENVGGKPLELSDYKIYCVNRGKKMKVEEAFTLPAGTLEPNATFKVWTSESPVEVLPADATPLYAKKINQKKYPMVQLYQAGAVKQTVLVPVDLADETIHDVTNDRRPTISSLYGVKDAPDPWQAFDQAKLGEDYSVTLPILPADMSEAEEDQIKEAHLIYQIGFGEIVTCEEPMTKSAAKDKLNGWTYTGTIPGSAFIKAGELVRFAVEITDNANRTFRAPSFQNKDDGYEWYGTIVEPAAGMTDAKVQTFYLFADENSLKQMDVDVDEQDKSVVPYNARVGIYDALTGLYYDNVRIDLRGNTTARFPKKSHGLRFSKSQPLSCTDPVTGTVFDEIRKTSFVADYMDPAYIRQSLSFWLFREAGALAPYDYPVKLNLNGEFYQLAWNSNRFTDELIEDVYGLDPLGYAFKNCGTIQPGHHSSITTEKKTPDDENESDISVEKAFENTLPANGNDEALTGENEDVKYTKVVVNTFDLPAWLNYMAMTRITSETDDTWSNISLYYDINGTGTWMPLAYDCHLSFGAFFCHDGKNGVRADVDFFKSHPFYGGRRVQAHSYSFDGNVQGYGSNSGLESIYQSPKFRRLYLRRLRTLMDELLEAPGTAQADSKIGGYIKLITDATAELAVADRTKWPLSGIYNFQNDSMNCWPNVASMTPAMGIEDLWNNYIVPRRVHLFETHSIGNNEKGVGYNKLLSAGIPAKQSSYLYLRAGVTAEYDATIGAVIIRNANGETIDLSGAVLTGPIEMTLPAGTILDQSINGTAGELYVTADRKTTVAAMSITDQVVVGNGQVGDDAAAITLTTKSGEELIGPAAGPRYFAYTATKPDDAFPAEWADQLTDMPSDVVLVLSGEGENGFAYSKSGNVTFNNLHLVFTSGKHSFTRLNDGAGVQFASGATPENPSILVEDDAMLTITSKDFSGWNCKVDTTGVIRVNDGGTLNLVNNGGSTFFFNQQLYLDPGSAVNVTQSSSDRFRVNGGINRATPQIYMPSSDSGMATITMNGGYPFNVGRDSNPNCAIFVGDGSTLVIDGNVSGLLGGDTARELVKYGTGKLKITGTITNVDYTEADKPTLCKVDGHSVGTFEDALVFLAAEGSIFEIVDPERMSYVDNILTVDGEVIDLDAKGLTLEDKGGVLILKPNGMAEGSALIITEVMPKSTDAINHGALESYDVNGLASGWVEVKNTSDKWVDLADYKFIRVNRSKANSKGDYGNFPSRLIAPHSLAVFYTSERYANSADMSVSAFATAVDAEKPHIFAELNNVLVWPDKVNPKKFPFVRLYYAPNGVEEAIIDTIVIPSDIPEGMSIVVEPIEDGEATIRYICEAPTRGGENPSTEGLVALGPNVGPLYEIKDGKKHNSANEFVLPVAPAKPDEDYTITFAANPVMSPTESAKFRAEDELTKIELVYRSDLDDATLKTKEVDLTTLSKDAKDWGNKYTTTIPQADLPEPGHLVQWKFRLTDASGNTWISPSFHNPDDGYEWYGTIVEPDSSLVSEALPTWHMFVDDASKSQMDVDADKQTLVNNARVAIYDATTSNYYDYVRIDLRGNTTASFYKKSHGLRFAKAHPLTMTDIVTGEEIEEIRKTSLIAEWADPSFIRQMMAFWLWRKAGNNVPYDFPIRCNLNGEFYQLAFCSERFTDELIEDVYGLDKFGYGYKSVGTLESGGGSTAGGIEKKTPDDEDEGNISVLQNELRSKIIAAKNVPGTTTAALSSTETDPTGLDNAELTKTVVERFDLPAWINYLASARITHEADDVWGNLCAYYDNPTMLEGKRGTGTWMPLGYDFNLSFGQHYKDGGVDGMMANQDWFKSHPFYGGWRVRCWCNDEYSGNPINFGNCGFESVLQSTKFRRLFLRRLRTLMDTYLGAPNADETLANSEFELIVTMREMVNKVSADAALDRDKWGYGSGTIIANWGSNFPKTPGEGLQDLWDNYIVPRRVHLFETHSIHNDSMATGYGSNLKAGIPDKQSAIADLRSGITAEYDATIGAVVIRNANEETIDLSDWELSGPVSMTIPVGTVIDQAIDGALGEVYVTADRRATVAAMTLTDQVIVGNGKAGKGDAKITLTAADGTKVIFEPSSVYNYLRLHSFDGVPPAPSGGDTNEWICMTNLSNEVDLDLAGVKITFLKQGDPVADAKCVVTLGAGTTLAAGGSIILNQADYGWNKITNNKLYITIADADGMNAQNLAVTQKDFKNYYGEGGPGGAYYLAATTFAQESETFIEIAYPVTEIDVKPGESVEVEADSAEEAVARTKLVVEIPDEVKELISMDDYKAYFAREATEVEAGKYKVSAVLNPETVPEPEIGSVDGETDPLIVKTSDDNTVVTIGIVNAQVGLWYGFETTGDLKVEFVDDVESFKLATNPNEKLELKSSPREEAAAFFKAVIRATKPISE